MSSGYAGRLLKEFVIDKILGSGTYGVVLQAVNREDHKHYAIKVVSGDVDVALREVENLVKIPSHPNVVHYYTCWQDGFTVADLLDIKQKLKLTKDDDTFRIPVGAKVLKVLCIQMELCGEDLRSWIGRQRVVSETRVTKMFIQIARGLEHIHKQKIIHRDLKPDNIFLGKDDPTLIKIGDLGIATEHLATKSAAHTRRMGTPLYLAPEQVSSRYGKPADMYALGLILFEMLEPKLQPRFNNGSYEFLIQGFIDLKYKNIISEDISTQWPKISELLLKMIKVSPEDRPSFEDIYETFESGDNKAQPKKDSNANIKQNNGSKPEGKPSDPKKMLAPAEQKKIIAPAAEPKKYVSPFEQKKILAPAADPKKIVPAQPKKTIAPAAEPKKNYVPAEQKKIVAPAPEPKKIDPVQPKKISPLAKPKKIDAEPSKIPPADKPARELCPGCFKPIEGGKITEAMDRKWHSEHFKCNQCFNALNNNYFEKNGKPYCEDDYHELFSPSCAYCEKSIRKTVKKAMGQTWHPEHFLCAHCRKPIEGTTFLVKDGKPYCQPDYFDLFVPKCAGCKKSLSDGKYTETENPTAAWHPHCFVCAECKQPLKKYFKREGNFYCNFHK